MFRLIGALKEHYNVSLPLAFLLSLGGVLACGRHLKLDLQDLALHNRIEHNGSLTHADAGPGCRYAPIRVDKKLLDSLLDVTKNPDYLTPNDLVKVRAMRDATLSSPLSRVHGIVARGEVALTIQTFVEPNGNISKQYIREWFGDERLPIGWSKPTTQIGLRSTTRIANWVWQLLTTGRID